MKHIVVRRSQRPAVVLATFALLCVQLVPVVVAQDVPGTPIAQSAELPSPPHGSVPGSEPVESLVDDDVTVRGMDASANYFIPLPPWTSMASGSRLDLEFTHSPLLVPERSTLTVVANGQSVDSVFLTPETQNRARLSVDLPVAAPETRTYAIRIQLRMRLTDDACEDPDDPALWTTIHKESMLSLVTTPAAEPPTLDTLQTQFVQGGESSPPPLVVLPVQPSPEELEAAGLISFQLDRWQGRANSDAALRLLQGEAPPLDAPAILIGTGSALPMGDGWSSTAWDGSQYLVDGNPVPADQGILALRQQPVPHLLVSGATPAAVREAALALARSDSSAPLSGSAMIVTGAPPPPTPPDEYAWEEGAASFAQLGVRRQEVIGPGDQFIDLPFQRPASWVLQEGGTLQLAIDAAPSIRPETSWVRVSVNGLEVGSQPLQPGTAGIDRYVFVLPAGRLNNELDGQPVRQLSVQIRLHLDYPREACVPIDREGVWAALLPTSAWVLPHEPYEGRDIGRFPSEFLDVATNVPVTVVLPDDPTTDELEAVLHVAAALGRWNPFTRTQLPRLVTVANVSDEERGAMPVIAIGGTERNRLSADAAEQQSERFGVLPPAVFAAVPEGPWGTLTLGPSP